MRTFSDPKVLLQWALSLLKERLGKKNECAWHLQPSLIFEGIIGSCAIEKYMIAMPLNAKTYVKT
jgi:hypothetical protein